MSQDAEAFRWDDLETDHPLPLLDRKRINGEKMMISHVTLHAGFKVAAHQHNNEQFAIVLSGKVRFTIGESPSPEEMILTQGDVLHLPPNVVHAAEAIETTVILDLFSPPSESTGVDATANS